MTAFPMSEDYLRSVEDMLNSINFDEVKPVELCDALKTCENRIRLLVTEVRRQNSELAELGLVFAEAPAELRDERTRVLTLIATMVKAIKEQKGREQK